MKLHLLLRIQFEYNLTLCDTRRPDSLYRPILYATLSVDVKDNMFSALFSGIVDNLMQQLQFNTTNRQPLNGVSSSKKATHFVDGDDKFASSDAALKSRYF